MREENRSSAFIADLNKDGQIDYPKNEINQIFAGDSIILCLNTIFPISHKAHLVINLPKEDTGKPSYLNSSPISNLDNHEEHKITKDSFLAEIKPIRPSFGKIQFEIFFKYPGNFFYQIVYYDSNLKSFSNVK